MGRFQRAAVIEQQPEEVQFKIVGTEMVNGIEITRLADLEDRRWLAARMAVCFGKRQWHLEVLSPAELEEIIRTRRFQGVNLDCYGTNPKGGVQK